MPRSGQVVPSLDRDLRLALRHAKAARARMEEFGHHGSVEVLSEVVDLLLALGAKPTRRGVTEPRQVNC